MSTNHQLLKQFFCLPACLCTDDLGAPSSSQDAGDAGNNHFVLGHQMTLEIICELALVLWCHLILKIY